MWGLGRGGLGEGQVESVDTAMADGDYVAQFEGNTLALILCDSPGLDISNKAIQTLKGNIERAGRLGRHDGWLFL